MMQTFKYVDSITNVENRSATQCVLTIFGSVHDFTRFVSTLRYHYNSSCKGFVNSIIDSFQYVIIAAVQHSVT